MTFTKTILRLCHGGTLSETTAWETSIPFGCQFKYQLLQFRSRSLLMYLRNQPRMAQVLGFLHSCRKPVWNSKLLSGLAEPGCYIDLRNKPVHVRSLSVFL